MAERRKHIRRDDEAPSEEAPHLREVGGADHLPNVCQTLRQARLRAGHDIKDVAKALRIRPNHLEALEAGRFKDLPGPTYVTGFLRSYAEFLGINRDDIVLRYRNEIGAGARQKLSFPTPSYEGRVPRFWLVLGALVLVGAAYAGWHYYNTRNEAAPPVVAEPPADPASDARLAAGADLAAERTADATEADSTVGSPASAVSTEQPAAASTSAPSVSTAPPEVTSGVGGSLFDGSGSAPPVTSAPPPSVNESSEATPAPTEPSAAPTSSGSRSLWNDSSAPSASPSATTAAASSSTTVTTTAADADATATGSLAPPTEADIAALEEGSEAAVATTTDRSMESEPYTAAAAPTEEPAPAATAAAPAEEPAPVATAAVVPEEPATVAPAATESRVVVSARVDSWVQIQGPGNELVLTSILRPGETYTVPNRPGLVMVTGNAGGIDIMVDGQRVGPLGPVGVVKRNIALDPDSLRSVYGTAQ